MTLNYAEAIYALDDSDLDVYQSRVWLRVLRRGVCYESQRSMAKSMNISLGKVNEALQWLLENGWIVREVDEKTQKLGYAAVLPHEQSVLPHEQVQQNGVHVIEHVLPHEQSVLPHERHLKAKEIKESTTAAAREAEKKNDSAFVFYENNIGGISPRISEWIQDAIDQHGERVVVDAMDEAVKSNVRRWKYVRAILDNWKQNGRIKPSSNGHKPNGAQGDGVSVWDTALDHARRGDSNFADPALKTAVRVFGWRKLQEITPGDENYYRKDFLRIYHEQSTVTATQ